MPNLVPKLLKTCLFFVCCALVAIAGLFVVHAPLGAQTPDETPETEEKVLPNTDAEPQTEETPQAPLPSEDAPPEETQPEEEKSPDAADEQGEEEQKPDGLDPEQMTPDPGVIIGDGDEMVMQDNLVQIHGNALVKYGDVVLRADHVWADFNENLMRASGNVHLISGNEETFSDELVFNLETKKGIARNGFTYTDPWYFGGTDIFKIGEKKSYIRSATLTTCSLKYPHYYFSVSRVIVRVNEEMIAKNIVLRIGGYPLFYFPAIRRDLRKGKVAKIIVKVGTDSYQGPYVSIIQPIARKRRYDGALLYDESTRRGRGFGFEGKYRFNDTQFREIYIPIPPDATAAQRTKLEEKAKEIHERLEGDHDRYWLKQLFLPYEITEDDVNRAKETAAELLKQLKEENADFAELAQRNSDHETRYEGGDLGFIVRGERIEEKTPATSKTQSALEAPAAPETDEEETTPEGTPPETTPEGAPVDAAPAAYGETEETEPIPAGKPKLDPILEEAAFQLEEGEISPVLKTESAFHILKVERVLDIYGEREIQLRRIDIAIAASDETQQKLRETTDIIHARALEGETFEELAAEFNEATLSEVNNGDGLPLSEMDASWRYSVRRLEEQGDITQRRPISTPEGLYLFQLMRKEETPTFEALAEELDAEWETFLEEVMSSTEEPKENGLESPEPGTSTEPGPPTEGASQDDAETAQSEPPTLPEEDVPAESSPEDVSTSVEETADSEADPGEEDEEGEEGEEEEPFTVYRKHGYRGRWEDPSPVASEAQSLYGGEFSKVIPTRKAFRLIKVDKKRTYRGDIYFYGADHYSFDRQNPSRIGRRWNMRWGHTQSLYTPWDSRREGRRPISFTGRTEWRALTYKEELKLPGESTLNTFGLITYGAAFSALDEGDRDENGNLRFSRQPTGDFTGRLELRHIHDFTGEGTTSLQKLPQLTLNFSRMRFSGLPLFRTINSNLVTLAENAATEKPFLSLLAVPTLENTSFDLDVELGNFYRQIYKGALGDERDVFLQTMDLGFDLRKQSTLLITPLRELLLNMNLNTNVIWHDQDQEKNRNIVRGVYSLRGSATNTLFRVYNISFIPRMRKLRHEMQSTVTFDYQPDVDENKNLYPFGPSTYFYERKSLSYNFDTNVEIKTQRSQSPHRVLQLRTQLRADFTEFDPLNKRRYEPIESNFTFIPLPSRSLNMTVRLTHDPNPDPDDEKIFKMVGLRSNIRYTRQSWNVSIGSSFSKRHTSRRASRSITASGRYRFSENLDFDVSVIYYPIDGQFYSQRISLNRNLHDWNLRISWSRVGIKRGEPPYNSVRQDFTFQISLMPEPALSMGVGYDATTDTWGIRTLPAGAPYNAFGVGNSLGRSYF